MIPFGDFAKLDIRVGKIEQADRIPESERLMRLSVDVGGETRQIVAGIGAHYDPQALLGREIIVIVNLEPKQLMGFESRGMLLAADDAAGPVLLAPDRDVPPGTKVK